MTVYIIMKCKMDGKVKTEAEFTPGNAPSVRVPARMENEYTVSVQAPGKYNLFLWEQVFVLLCHRVAELHSWNTELQLEKP